MPRGNYANVASPKFELCLYDEKWLVFVIKAKGKEQAPMEIL
jgi:hypothetical protein